MDGELVRKSQPRSRRVKPCRTFLNNQLPVTSEMSVRNQQLIPSCSAQSEHTRIHQAICCMNAVPRSVRFGFPRQVPELETNPVLNTTVKLSASDCHNNASKSLKSILGLPAPGVISNSTIIFLQKWVGKNPNIARTERENCSRRISLDTLWRVKRKVWSEASESPALPPQHS